MCVCSMQYFVYILLMLHLCFTCVLLISLYDRQTRQYQEKLDIYVDFINVVVSQSCACVCIYVFCVCVRVFMFACVWAAGWSVR